MSPSSVGPGRSVALLVTLVASWLLVACATRVPGTPMPKYVAPVDGATAKLVMRGSVQPGDGYGVYLYEDSERCGGMRSMGSGNATRNPASTTLAANRLQTLEFFLVKPNRQYCSIRWTFTPTAGKTYLLNGGALANGCAARVMDMTDADNMKPEPTALRRNPGTTQCLPLSQSKGSSVAGSDTSNAGHDAVLKPGATADDLKGLIGQ